MDMLFDKAGYPVSDDCTGQASSRDEFEVAKINEPSDELMFERDETDDLEFESEPDGGAPKGVRARTERRFAAGRRINSPEVGLCFGFSAILPGPGNKDS
jgi:hypothetical protein